MILVPQPLIARWHDMLRSLHAAIWPDASPEAGFVRVVDLRAAEPAVAAFQGRDGLPDAASAALRAAVREKRGLLRCEGAEAGGGSWLGLPILGHTGRFWGLLEIWSPGPDGFPDSALRLAEIMRDAIQDQIALNALRQPIAPDASNPAQELERLRLALRESEQRFHILVENALDDFFMHDDRGRFLHVNERACRSLGYTREELMGMSASDVSSDLTQAEKEELYRTTPPGASARITARHKRKDGSSFPVEVLISCHMLEGRKVFLGMVRDVTEREVADAALAQLNAELEERVVARTQELRETTDRLQAVLDNAPDAISLTDANGRVLLANRAAHALPRGDSALLRVESCARAREVLEGAEAVTFEEEAKDANREMVLLTTHSPRRDHDGRVIGLVSLSRDITAQKLAERHLQDSFDRLERAENLARIGSWTLDLATGKFASSAMLCIMNGVEPGTDVTVADLQRMMPPGDFARVGQAIQNCIATGAAYTVDVVHYHPSGGSFAGEIRGQAVRGPDGNIVAITGTVQDVSERVAARAQMAAIADSLPNGAIYRLDHLDPEFGKAGDAAVGSEIRFSYLSAGIEAMTGISAEAVMEDPTQLVLAIHEEDRARYLETSREATLAQSNFECEFRLRRNDGEIRWIQIRSAPRPAEGGRVWDGIILDVTPAHETAEALRRARDEAKAAERAKSDFLATMSHEIRTPMNSVIGMTRLALQTELSERQRNYLQKIDTSARALLGIINDILDFSRIEAGGMALEEIDFTLDSVLDTVSNATTLRAEEKGLEIVYSRSGEVPPELRGDPLRLGQVLINLVGNAVKFTDAGVIEVAIAALPARDASGRQLLEFSVRDTGIGLSAEQMASLFRPFTQADSRTARHFGGTGLGLSISRQLVGLMGGEIRVESRPGAGSTFTFTAALVPTSAAERRQRAGFSGRRVLIVDDVATAREALVVMTGHFGLTSRAVSSGPAALAALREAASQGAGYDLVLMDWHMPGMDGLEAARMIRADRSLRHVPAVLMVTAHAREEIIERVAALELQGLLIKPVTESMMFDALQQILASAGAEEIAVQPQPISQTIPGGLKGRRVLVVDDNAFNLEVASDFLDLAGVEVVTAESGAEALERLAQGSFDAVLMDMQMPGMDGLEATRRIRANPAWTDLPVIALTAQARIEDREATQLVGMTEHLTKPIDEHLLYATLERVLARSPGQPAEKVIDLDRALARVRGDHQRLQRMLDLFLRDFGTCPDQARAAIAAGDGPALAAIAHRVRGVAGYFAADALGSAAEVLEQDLHRDPAAEVADGAQLFVRQLEAVLSACSEALPAQDPAAG